MTNSGQADRIFVGRQREMAEMKAAWKVAGRVKGGWLCWLRNRA